MLTLVSDLHLSDSPARPTINVPRLLDHLAGAFAEARRKGVGEITLMLLGDILEVLKSEVWLERGVRPWEPFTPAQQDAVSEIVGKIIAANKTFFDGLNRMVEEHEGRLRVQYVTGNHDRPLWNDLEMGAGGRALLQSALPALSLRPEEQFIEKVFNPEHRVRAEHGHEFDPSNHYEPGLAAFGDAIVIELVLNLPREVRRGLGAAESDPDLDFLYELDNVRPHSPSALLQWIDHNLSDNPALSSRVNEEIPKALRQILGNFRSLKKSVAFASFEGVERRMELLLWALERSADGYRRLANLLPQDDDSSYHSSALTALQLLQDMGSNWRYFVCGHTHDPVIMPLDIGEGVDDRVRVYFNTGTWRRVLRPTVWGSEGARVKAFSCWEEQCVVTVYGDDDRGRGYPPYEFHRLTSGAYV